MPLTFNCCWTDLYDKFYHVTIALWTFCLSQNQWKSGHMPILSARGTWQAFQNRGTTQTNKADDNEIQSERLVYYSKYPLYSHGGDSSYVRFGFPVSSGLLLYKAADTGNGGSSLSVNVLPVTLNTTRPPSAKMTGITTRKKNTCLLRYVISSRICKRVKEK